MTETDRDEIRADMRRRRAAMDVADRELAAYALSRRLLATQFYRAANRIGAYLPFGAELDINPVIARAWQQGKQVYVPVIESVSQSRMRFARLRPDTPLLKNRFGIDEPDPEHREFLESRWLDLALVPLVAFDNYGNRLGMGAGYYDRCFRFLSRRTCWKKPRLCGIAYAFQQADRIDPAEWDVPLTCVVTENALVLASKTDTRN